MENIVFCGRNNCVFNDQDKRCTKRYLSIIGGICTDYSRKENSDDRQCPSSRSSESLR